MVTTLTGENSYALGAALAERINRFVQEYGELGLERLDGEEVELSRIVDALTSLPFLTGRKLVVLRTPGSQKAFVEQADTLLKQVPETTNVIIVEPKLDKRLAYSKFLRQGTDFFDYPELDDQELARWLVTEAERQAWQLSPTDARYLVERVGANQALLAHELEKLGLYSPTISRANIDELTEPAPASTIFELLDAAFAGRRRDLLALYKQQRALKVEPPQIIAMLAWQLHVLAVIKTAADRLPAQIAREAGLNPFVIQRSQAIARRLTLNGLKDLLTRLLKLDVQLKTTSVDADEALQHYLLTISKS